MKIYALVVDGQRVKDVHAEDIQKAVDQIQNDFEWKFYVVEYGDKRLWFKNWYLDPIPGGAIEWGPDKGSLTYICDKD